MSNGRASIAIEWLDEPVSHNRQSHRVHVGSVQQHFVRSLPRKDVVLVFTRSSNDGDQCVCVRTPKRSSLGGSVARLW